MTSDNQGLLTKREREIVSLIGQGLDSRDIANALGIAYFTVRKHRSNILYKLQLSSSAQLSVYSAKVSVRNIRLGPDLVLPGLP